MENEDFKSIATIIFFVCLVFSLFYLVILFPEYFAGFFFGLLFYSTLDAYNKKDL